jgi:hypothetical protein
LLCLALQKIGPDFSRKVVLKLKLPKNVLLKSSSSMKIHFESPILALCDELAKLGKASQDAYNPGLWLIL